MYALVSEFSDKKKFYLCTETADVEKLPKYDVNGTQGTNEKDDEPCLYGSIALVKNGSETNVYMLFPANDGSDWSQL